MRIAMMAVVLLAGCGSQTQAENEAEAQPQLTLVAAEPTAVTAPPANAQPQLVGGSQRQPPSPTPKAEYTPLQATLSTQAVWDRSLGAEAALEVVNTAEHNVSYTVASGMLADFWLVQGNKVVWRYSQEMAFTQALTEFRLPGQGQRTISVRVAPSSLTGLADGRYELRSSLNFFPREKAPAVAPVTVTLVSGSEQ